MHYVIGDVHGCYDELMELLKKIENKDPDAQLLFVGDFIDRGPKVGEVLAWAMEHITEDGRYQTVRGNHEQMVIDWYSDFLDWQERKEAGVQYPMPQTHYDFSQWLEAKDKLSPEKIEPYIRFFESMPYSRRLTIRSASGNSVTYRIVHAWYDYGETEDSAIQHQCNIWERNFHGNFETEEIIIHGHTPTIASDYLLVGMQEYADAPGLICYRPGAVNIDGGCCFARSFSYTGFPCMLCAVCLETLEEIYPYTLEERMAQRTLEEIFCMGVPKPYASMNESKARRFLENMAGKDAEKYRKKYRKKTPQPRLAMLKRLEGRA